MVSVKYVKIYKRKRDGSYTAKSRITTADNRTVASFTA